jgi:hypothetical protein
LGAGGFESKRGRDDDVRIEENMVESWSWRRWKREGIDGMARALRGE